MKRNPEVSAHSVSLPRPKANHFYNPQLFSEFALSHWLYPFKVSKSLCALSDEALELWSGEGNNSRMHQKKNKCWILNFYLFISLVFGFLKISLFNLILFCFFLIRVSRGSSGWPQNDCSSCLRPLKARVIELHQHVWLEIFNTEFPTHPQYYKNTIDVEWSCVLLLLINE